MHLHFEKKIYLFAFFDQFLLIYPVYSIFFLENGLDYKQISLLLVIWAATALLLEIPLGIVGDIFSRKQVLLMSRVAKVFAFITWILFPSFSGFAFGFFIWGVAGALTSGTLEAFVYDELKSKKRTKEYEKISGRMNASMNIGVALSLVLGGILAERSFNLVLYLTIVSILISTSVLILTKSKVDRKADGNDSFTSLLKLSRKELEDDKLLILLMIIFLLIFGVYGSIDEYVPILLFDIGFSKTLIGIIGFFGYMFYALGGLAAGSGFRKYMPYWSIMLAGIFGYLVFFFTRSSFGIILLFFVAFLLAMLEVWINADIQRKIPSNIRATILSVANMGSELFGIIILILMGIVSEINIWYSILLTGTLLLIPLVVTVYYSKKLS